MATALRLYGITDIEHHAQAKPPEGAELLPFRDVAAIVAPADYAAAAPSGEVIEQYPRVHVGRVDGKAAERDTGSEVAAAAADSLRSLRRHAVVAVPLKSEQVTGIVLSSAFLVDRELWDDFVAAVDDQRRRNPGLGLDLSGPWPPFDFVRMQFGS
jgi:hypothetical protein